MSSNSPACLPSSFLSKVGITTSLTIVAPIFSIDAMEKIGATIVNDVVIPTFDRNDDGKQAGELEDIDAYLASFPAVRRSYADICTSQRTATFKDAKECFKVISKIPKRPS